MQYPAEVIRTGLNRHGRVIASAAPSPNAVCVHLWDYGRDPTPPVPLPPLDKGALSDAAHYGQGYVLKSPGASDWLLNIEINGWDLDRGQGADDFARLVEPRIDRALQFKINMAFMDGFGFGVSKRPAYYRDLMLRLNRYARARGFTLCFGGYGASYGMAYEPVVMYEKGTAFKGQIVLAAELRGIGETEAGHDQRDYGRGRFGRDVQEISLAYLIGHSYVGMRTDDVRSWAQFLGGYRTTPHRPTELHLVAIGEAAIPALHVAALDTERFASVQLRNMISS